MTESKIKEMARGKMKENKSKTSHRIILEIKQKKRNMIIDKNKTREIYIIVGYKGKREIEKRMNAKLKCLSTSYGQIAGWSP